MKASVKWLKEFVDFDISVDELADRLSESGTKVEGIELPGAAVEGVVVAEVLDVADHPRADKLIVVEVSTAPGESRQVVCGARNFAVGDRVPFAEVGARVGDVTIEARQIRGVDSNGMLCSGAELGISKDHSGILVLPPDAELGTDVSAVMGLDDAILDLEVTPNRGDCMGMIGLAREVGALVGSRLRVVPREVPSSSLEASVSVTIEDPEGCPRYVARFIEGIKGGSSPSWMQGRLVRLGVRPVSVVVDVTNYVMLETGQPLHAFDAASVPDHRIVVRRATAGESLRTLDGQMRRLHPDDLVIADSTRPIALAGVMGGELTEVSDSTDSVILEAAVFDNAAVAYASRRHSLRSEASARFERGVDAEMAPVAAARAAALMAELAGGSVAPGAVDEYPAPITPRRITLRPARTGAVLGYEISGGDQAAHLRALELEVTSTGNALEAAIPSWRRDLYREIDLIEEVARLAGFGRLPSTLPPGRAGGLDTSQAAERRVRRILAGFGVSEAWTSSFGSPEELDALGFPPDHPARAGVALANPTSDLDPILRTTLLPGLLRSTSRNLAQRARSVALFEIARIYEKSEEQLPREPLLLTAVFTGVRGTPSWYEGERAWDFFSAKGVLQASFASLGIEGLRFAPVKSMPWHPTRAAGVLLRDEGLGVLGELHPDVCERFAVTEGAVAFEIALEPVLMALPQRARVTELSRFPAVYIDLAFVVDAELSEARVHELIEGAGAPEVAAARLFDVYRGEQIAEGKKSLAYALELRAPDRTLTDADAESVTHRIVTALRERTGAELRS
ncbi:MAG: phenylalanine--tRNA ligase subunit beta [Actinomycetota bacterium]